MFNERIPTYFVIIGALAGGVISYFAFNRHSGIFMTAAGAPTITVATNKSSDTEGENCSYKTVRLKSGSFTKRLLFAEPACESDNFTSLKSDIENIVDNYKKTGEVSSVSVYLRDLTEGTWMSYEPFETYNPGSLAKVPLMMSYLMRAKTDKNLLSKEIVCPNHLIGIPAQTYPTQTIQAGHKYTIKELLYYMIAYSDNHATALLNEGVDYASFKKVFTDLGIPDNVNEPGYQITAKDYSEFFVVLYNATYLSMSQSEFADSLLSQCNFKQGMLKDIPPNIRVAHKFGEWSDFKSNVHQLHESGIVYLNDKPYLLTIMTTGSDVSQLTEVISTVSKMVYNKMAASNSY